MNPSDVRVYVVAGQGGWFTSAGFMRFAARLETLGYDVWDGFTWKHPHEIIKDITVRPPKHVALIGYSMGAVAITFVQAYRQKIDLLVGYDPSVGLFGGLIPATECKPIQPTVRRTLCYHRPNAMLAGGAIYTGHNVELVEVHMPHLAVQSSEELHMKTIRALQQVGEYID